MTDILVLQQRVRTRIKLGESHFREFKSALEGSASAKRKRPTSRICADIAKALVAFANADGGELLVGVEDDGTVTGVPHSLEDMEAMLGAVTTHVQSGIQLPLVAATQLYIDGTPVLFFSVMKGTTEIFQLTDGRCLRRRDRSSTPESVDRIIFDRQEIRSREYDRQFVDGASVADLDSAILADIASDYFQGQTIERHLQQQGLAEYARGGLRLRMAASLLFARDIGRWHPRSQVRIIRVNGTTLESGDAYNVTSDESVQDNVFRLLKESWDALRPSLAYKTEFGRDARFEQKYIYPEWACREALVNALAHRDYTIHNGIDVFIFHDRMEIRNPSALLSTISLQDLQELRGVHESRNALIAKVLRERNIMRELGEGMKRVFNLMEENELERPTLRSDAMSFSIILPHRSVFTAKQEQFLALFKEFRLSRLQKRIVAIGVDDRQLSQADTIHAMSTDDRDTYDREVTGLRHAGLLKEVRKNPAAARYARQHNVPKAEVPRFEVLVPLAPPVRPARPSPSRAHSATSLTERTVFVANLAKSVSSEELTNLFLTVGQVEGVRLPSDSVTGGNKGFAFVRLPSHTIAQEAILRLNGTKLHDRAIAVRVYTPK